MIWLKWISMMILLLTCFSCQQHLAGPTVAAVARPTVLPDEQAENEHVQNTIQEYIDSMEKALAAPPEETEATARRDRNQRRSQPVADEERITDVSIAPSPFLGVAPAASTQRPRSIDEVTAPPAVEHEPGLPPAARGQVGPAESSTDALIKDMLQRIQDEPGNTALEIDLRMLYHMAGDDAAALTPIEDIPQSEWESYEAMLRTWIKLRDNARSGSHSDEDVAEEVLPDLKSWYDRERQHADLKLLRLLLVRKVVSYGVVEVFEPAHFIAGRINPVIVYAELDNFSSESDDEGRYLTRLSQQITIFTKQGLEVSLVQDPLIKDISTTKRQDFFLARIVNIPAQLPPGEYILKLAVVDEPAGKAAERTTNFKLIAGTQ